MADTFKALLLMSVALAPWAMLFLVFGIPLLLMIRRYSHKAPEDGRAQ